VRDLYEEWYSHFSKLINNHNYLQLARNDQNPDPPLSSIRVEQDRERKAIKEAADRLAELMNSELAALPYLPESKADAEG
jgi:hypothetical protein